MSAPSPLRPPRFFAALLRRLLSGSIGDEVLEALEEEYAQRRATTGRLRSDLWYAAHLARPGTWGLARRLSVRRRPGRGSARDRLAGEVVYAFRSLRRAPLFSMTAVLVLALGIGGATAVFASLRSIVLDDLPVTDPDRLVVLAAEGEGGSGIRLEPADVQALAQEGRAFAGITGVAEFGAEAFPLSEGGRSLVLRQSRVMPDFFHTLGVRPAVGRMLRPEDGAEGAPPVAVISYDAWQREFAGDPQVVGRRLTQITYQEIHTIVGVAPPCLDYPIGAGYWVIASERDPLDVVARLAADATYETARAEFLSRLRSLGDPASEPLASASVRSLTDAVLGDARPLLWSIAGAVALLLLIACVNVGNLLLMWSTQRSRDTMVRRALGATSGAVVRQLLVEGALLGAAGGALGLVFGTAVLAALPAVAPDRLPRAAAIGLQGPPVAVAVAVTIVSILLFAIVPAGAARRFDPTALRMRSGASGTGRRRVRRVLVGVQVALAVVLLIGAGLLVRSMQHLTRLDLGYDAERTAIIELGFNRERRESPRETFSLLEGSMDRIRALPGVEAATPVMSRPFMGSTGVFQARPMLEAQAPSDVEAVPPVPLEVGDHELFAALGIPILRGRGFLETDREGAPRVAVVSETVSESLWPGENPLGRSFRMVTGREYTWTVVGVAADTRFRRLLETTPTIYLPVRQLQILPAVWTVAARTDGVDLAAILPAMRREIEDFDRRVIVWRAATLSDHLTHGPLSQPRTSAFLLSCFGATALLLASFGLYAVMSLAVRERTHELGIRKALGASAERLRRSVIGEALTTTFLGVVAGIAAALFLARMLESLLFETPRADPATLLTVTGLLLVVSAIAAYLPARRATRADALRSLRAE